MRNETSRRLYASVIFLVAASLYISLRSSNYLAVDGALRAINVYRLERPTLNGNEHLLYPVDIFIWTKLLNALGFEAHSPLEFLALAQSMNAAAA